MRPEKLQDIFEIILRCDCAEAKRVAEFASEHAQKMQENELGYSPEERAKYFELTYKDFG